VGAVDDILSGQEWRRFTGARGVVT